MTVSHALYLLRDALAPVAAEFALPEAERVLTFLLDCSRSRLYLSGGDALPTAAENRLYDIIRRRLSDEPLAYILGSAYFYDREFMVAPGVLIPRPDTEILVEAVLKNESGNALRFLDLGTGSGCIATILAEHNPSWRGIATDSSVAALRIAHRNMRGNCTLLCQDRMSAIAVRPWFDFIVSNPPYIPLQHIPSLDRSVRDFEPAGALDGGPDGLDFYRYLAEDAGSLLKPGGRIYCEIGCDQGDSAPAVFQARGWWQITVTNDLGHRPRVISAIRP